jgi:hypothetical protein
MKYTKCPFVYISKGDEKEKKEEKRNKIISICR